jgi:hypothetical protein
VVRQPTAELGPGPGEALQGLVEDALIFHRDLLATGRWLGIPLPMAIDDRQSSMEAYYYIV